MRKYGVCDCVYYRQDAAKRQTAGIKFTHRPKIRFFAPQGRLVAPIHVKFGTADGHAGPLSSANFHLNRRRGLGMRPQNIIFKNHFLIKSRTRRGESLDRFLKLLGDFMRLTILRECFKFDMILFTYY